MDLLFIILACVCIFVNGMNAGADFKNDCIGAGLIYSILGVLWMGLICMKIS